MMKHPYIQPKHDLGWAYILSLVIGFGMAGVSVFSLFHQDRFYPTTTLRETCVPNDVVNLLISMPILLGSIGLTYRGKLVGLLFLPGALLVVIYNYLVYMIGIPITPISIGYLALIVLSAAVIYQLLGIMDKEAIAERLAKVVPVKIPGWYLIVVGALVFIRAVFMVAQAVFTRTSLPVYEIGLLVADLVLSIAWFTGGVLLLQRKPLGYTIALGLLFATCMLFVGLVIFILLQPLLTGASLMLVDLIVVSLLTVIFSIPFYLYLRGTLSKPSG